MEIVHCLDEMHFNTSAEDRTLLLEKLKEAKTFSVHIGSRDDDVFLRFGSDDFETNLVYEDGLDFAENLSKFSEFFDLPMFLNSLKKSWDRLVNACRYEPSLYHRGVLLITYGDFIEGFLKGIKNFPESIQEMFKFEEEK